MSTCVWVGVGVRKASTEASKYTVQVSLFQAGGATSTTFKNASSCGVDFRSIAAFLCGNRPNCCRVAMLFAATIAMDPNLRYYESS